MRRVLDAERDSSDFADTTHKPEKEVRAASTKALAIVLMEALSMDRALTPAEFVEKYRDALAEELGKQSVEVPVDFAGALLERLFRKDPTQKVELSGKLQISGGLQLSGMPQPQSPLPSPAHPPLPSPTPSAQPMFLCSSPSSQGKIRWAEAVFLLVTLMAALTRRTAKL